MDGNNGNGSRRNGNNGRALSRKMNLAPTRHQPRRGVRNLTNARAAAQAAPQVRVSGPVRTRKAARKNATPYARASKNKANNISLSGLSFGNSSFKMNRFNPKKAAKSYAPNFAPSGFVPLNAQQAFQLQLNQNIAAQAAANAQHLANVAARRSLGAKKAAATRKAKKEALLAAQAAAAAAMEEVREAEQVVVAQQQSSSGVSAHAERALANAQRAAQNADRAFQRALQDIDLNENDAGAASASSAASANNLSSMFGRL